MTLRGKQCLTSSIPYPLYLRCITTYADKYDRRRYSIYRFYRDVINGVDVNTEIGRLYPNVLDHVVLDSDALNNELIARVDDDDTPLSELIGFVAESHLIGDAVATVHRFACRCLALDRSNALSAILARVISITPLLPSPLVSVFLLYGANLRTNGTEFFHTACYFGLCDIIQMVIRDGRVISVEDVVSTIESGNCDAIKCIHGACREHVPLRKWRLNLINATVEFLELLMSLNLIQRGKHYTFSNIPSFSVLQWILDHDVMEQNRLLIDIASSASHYSGHYFDMLRYLIEQRNFTVPRDILIVIDEAELADLSVLDCLFAHGADINFIFHDFDVVLRMPMFIRYLIDYGVIIEPLGERLLFNCIESNMTVPVLEMMIDKYELNVNAARRNGETALQIARRDMRYEIIEMLIRHGAA